MHFLKFMKTCINLNKKKIAIFSGDPAGGKILSYLAKEIEKKYKIYSFATGSSIEIFKKRKVKFKKLIDNISIKKIKQKIKKIKPQLVITGAGTYNMIEHNSRLASNELKLQTISINDYWFEYGSRFKRTIFNKTIYSIPDWIFTMDNYSKYKIKFELKKKLKKTKFFITGFANLDIINKKNKNLLNIKKKIKIVFFSDAIIVKNKNLKSTEGICIDKNGKSIFGYFPHTIIEKIFLSLLKFNKKYKIKIIFLIKPHPREDETKIKALIKKYQFNSSIKIMIINKKKDSIEVMKRGNVIMGMASVALLESSLLKKPTISVQIGLKKNMEDPCISNKFGWSVPVYDEKKLDQLVKKIVFNRKPLKLINKNKIVYKGALKKIIKKIDQVI